MLLGRRDYAVSGGSYKTSHAPWVHFGLGTRTDVDLEVRLPGGDVLWFEAIDIDAAVWLDVP